ncbi:MAG TPA: hypothetical protein VGH28_32235 [Polyangiaceae bacterium]
MSLSVCPSCSRHVKETRCPFCGGEVVHAPRAVSPRAARIVLLGGAAAIATACGSMSPQPLYGAVMPDASNDAADAAQNDAAPNDAAQNDVSPGPMYGAVMPDAGDE